MYYYFTFCHLANATSGAGK